MQRRVRYDDIARLAAGASRVHLREHVSSAADVDVSGSTAALPHPTVLSRLHQNNGARLTGRVESFPLTVLHHTRRPRLCSHRIIIIIIH